MFREQYAGQVKFGQMIPTDPMVGLLDVVAKSAGFILYLEQRIKEAAGVDGDVRLTDEGLDGREAPAVLVDLWRRERQHLAAVCKMAIDAGVARQQLDLVKSYQERVLDLVEGVLTDLGHDPDAISVSSVVMRRLALATAPAPDTP